MIRVYALTAREIAGIVELHCIAKPYPREEIKKAARSSRQRRRLKGSFTVVLKKMHARNGALQVPHVNGECERIQIKIRTEVSFQFS